MKVIRTGAAAFACALLLSACQQQGGEAQEAQANEEEKKTPPVPVETAQPVRGDVLAVYGGTAPIEAFAEADVIAKVDGEVREVLVEEGTDVTEDQILARLDGDRLRLELNESQARLQKMQRDFNRNQDLKDKGLLSEGDFERLQYDLQALQADYNLAKLELDYTQIRAPISGVVSQRYIKLGNTVRVGEPLFRVTSFDPLVAYLHVPEREYRQISAGHPVAIDIDALAGERILASVTRISPIVDAETGTFKITIEIRDDTRRIKPGMFGRISIVYDQHVNVLKVPRSAIVEEMGVSSIFVVEDGIARRRVVETGYSESGMVEIVSGLEDEDEIITVGQIGLKPDSNVTVINAPPEEAATPAAEPPAAEAVTEDDN